MEQGTTRKAVKTSVEEFIVDSSEFELVRKFLEFIRGRERGVFEAEIVTHQKRRYVKLKFTDQDLINLKHINDDNTT